MSLAVVAGSLLLSLGSAAPPRAPARGGVKLSSCPKGGSSPAAAHDDREAGIEAFARDYEISTSYENGSTCGAQAGENGLDGAFPRRALATSAAARNTWLQLYKNYGVDGLYADAFDSETINGAAKTELDPNKYQAGGGHALHAIEQPVTGTTMSFAAPDATEGGVDGEAAAQSYLGRTSWCLFQVLASVVPRRSSSAKGAAWRLSVVGYLVI